MTRISSRKWVRRANRSTSWIASTSADKAVQADASRRRSTPPWPFSPCLTLKVATRISRPARPGPAAGASSPSGAACPPTAAPWPPWSASSAGGPAPPPGARPVIQDPSGMVEFLLAAQPAGHRCQLLDEIGDRPPQGRQGPLLVDDDLGLDAVPGGPPLVLPHDPRLRAGQSVAPVDERIHP